MIGRNTIRNWFTHHPPKDDAQTRVYEGIRESGRLFAQEIDDRIPDGAEKDQAIAHIRAAVMWANAGIACDERGQAGI